MNYGNSYTKQRHGAEGRERERERERERMRIVGVLNRDGKRIDIERRKP
jgi:hypothetical protein